MAGTVNYKLKIIYNDDAKVIDFLADLSDRNPITTLQRALDGDPSMRCCFVSYYREEKISVVLMCNAPFDLNEGDNVLMLFIHADIPPLYAYFSRWMANTEYSESDQRMALKETLTLLGQVQRQIEIEKEAQPKILG